MKSAVSLFGPLEWNEENRDARICEATLEDLFQADSLEGLVQAPTPFMTIEGQITDVFKARGRWYVNFGADYKTDFTISLQGAALKNVRRAWPKPNLWIGEQVRARGYVDEWNGLLIEWNFPEQVCFLDRVPTAAQSVQTETGIILDPQ